MMFQPFFGAGDALRAPATRAGRGCLALLAMILGFGAAVASGAVRLELRPVPEPCLSQEVAVDLYAVSDTGSPQAFSAMDVILTWNPGRLQLLRRENIGPYTWLSSGFPPDSGLDGLNNTFLDGDALYSALSRFGTPAQATPSGLLVVRFVFKKLLVGPPATDVNMPPTRGMFSVTAVYSAVVPGQSITGTLQGALLVPVARGDTNCDGLVNFDDIGPFVTAMVGEVAYMAEFPGCVWLNADMDCSAFCDFDDIGGFVEFLAMGGI